MPKNIYVPPCLELCLKEKSCSKGANSSCKIYPQFSSDTFNIDKVETTQRAHDVKMTSY